MSSAFRRLGHRVNLTDEDINHVFTEEENKETKEDIYFLSSIIPAVLVRSRDLPRLEGNIRALFPTTSREAILQVAGYVHDLCLYYNRHIVCKEQDDHVILHDMTDSGERVADYLDGLIRRLFYH